MGSLHYRAKRDRRTWLRQTKGEYPGVPVQVGQERLQLHTGTCVASNLDLLLSCLFEETSTHPIVRYLCSSRKRIKPNKRSFSGPARLGTGIISCLLICTSLATSEYPPKNGRSRQYWCFSPPLVRDGDNAASFLGTDRLGSHPPLPRRSSPALCRKRRGLAHHHPGRAAHRRVVPGRRRLTSRGCWPSMFRRGCLL